MLTIKTIYPGARYFLKINTGSLVIHNVENSDTYKISKESQTKYMSNILDDLNKKYYFISSRIENPVISFKDTFVSLEDFRNMSEGYINDLISDDSGYDTSKIGSFGFLAGETKPQRIKFIEVCKETPDYFEYIETKKYNPKDQKMLSFLDIKKKFKYLIDLQGHSYSTKIYSFMHSKRVMFLPDIPKYFPFEERIMPYVHYIPVKADLSNLLDQYNYIESKPAMQADILNNCLDLINNMLSQDKLVDNFKSKLLNIYNFKLRG